MDIKKTHVLKKIGLHVQNMISILGSKISIIRGRGGGREL
jgi:hypothetical protein